MTKKPKINFDFFERITSLLQRMDADSDITIIITKHLRQCAISFFEDE